MQHAIKWLYREMAFPSEGNQTITILVKFIIAMTENKMLPV